MSYLDVVYKDVVLKKGDYVHQLTAYLVEEALGWRGDVSAKHLLDVGCGKGLQAACFARYMRVSGLDMSDESRPFLKEFNAPVEVRTCDLETDKYPYDDESFDVVFSKSVIEHMRDPFHFIDECARLLKPGGSLLLMTPSWRTQYINFYDDPTHVRPFTEKGLRQLLLMRGYRQIRVREFYQLPFVWKFPWSVVLPKLVSFLPDAWKWRDEEQRQQRPFVRFSKETMLLATAVK